MTTSIFLLLSVACNDPEVASRSYPVVNTHDVSDITDQDVTFHGEILNVGNGVADHGFLYSQATVNDYSISFMDRVSLGALEAAGSFSAVATNNMIKGRKYYVRAYATSKTGGITVLGQETNFISQGSIAPAISDFNPKQGEADDEVLITGSGFSTVPSNNIVFFGPHDALILNATPNSLSVKVPHEATEGDNTIRVEVAEQSATAANKFKVL